VVLQVCTRARGSAGGAPAPVRRRVFSLHVNDDPAAEALALAAAEATAAVVAAPAAAAAAGAAPPLPSPGLPVVIYAPDEPDLSDVARSGKLVPATGARLWQSHLQLPPTTLAALVGPAVTAATGGPAAAKLRLLAAARRGRLRSPDEPEVADADPSAPTTPVPSSSGGGAAGAYPSVTPVAPYRLAGAAPRAAVHAAEGAHLRMTRLHAARQAQVEAQLPLQPVLAQ
jgi:hypothetical protein